MIVQLVKATRSFQGSNTENCVSEGELLVVKTAKNKITGTYMCTCIAATAN